ncbi:hypothetical protein AB0H73_06335 [Streptomyces olivoreticuli]
MRKQYSPHEADWSVELVLGKTFCPETLAGGVCTHREPGDVTTDHDREYGTDTSDSHLFLQGGEPTLEEIESLIMDPNDTGWYVIEFAARATSHGVYSHLWKSVDEEE